MSNPTAAEGPKSSAELDVRALFETQNTGRHQGSTCAFRTFTTPNGDQRQHCVHRNTYHAALRIYNSHARDGMLQLFNQSYGRDHGILEWQISGFESDMIAQHCLFTVSHLYHVATGPSFR
jgi:hypothetical protein